jgi:hypothetical protein
MLCKIRRIFKENMGNWRIYFSKKNPKFSTKKYPKLTRDTEVGKLELCVKMESIVHGRGFNNEGIMHGVLIFKEVVECASLSCPPITFGITIPRIRGISSPLKIHLNANLMFVSRSTLERVFQKQCFSNGKNFNTLKS